jgi:hypothetical protein
MAVCGTLAAFLSLLTVRRFRRRHLLILGYVLVCFFSFCVAVSDVTDFDWGALVVTVLMVVTFFTLI